MVQYKLYPSLLDAFAWMQKSESETAAAEFIDKVNRVRSPATDPMMRGVAFERILNDLNAGVLDVSKIRYGAMAHDVKVSGEIIQRFHARLAGSVTQVRVETVIPTRHGDALVYGYVDNVLEDEAFDVKTTARYEFPKYLHSFQRPTYLEALAPVGVSRFTFLVTDFNEVWEERYERNEAGRDRLIDGCEQLIGFLEENRNLITDRRVFGED